MIKNEIPEFPIIYANASKMGKVAVGWGVHKTVGDECKAVGIKSAFITTTGLKGTGIVEEIVGILNYHGISTEVFNKVTSNPKDHEVMEAYRAFKDSQCDGVVSVGGGSSHDCGKGLRAVYANDGVEITELFMGLGVPSKRKPANVPQISVNTTAGTGAENTGGAAVTNTKGKVKVKGLASVPNLACTISLNDPLLIRLQPPIIAAGTAFDAFTHAFEMFVSRIQSQISLALAYRAIKLVSENIREFTYNRMNSAACEKICWCTSLAGGYGLGSGGGQGIVHGIGHGLSANWGVHHGLANMVVTIPAERYNLPACPERFADMAQAMGVDTRNMSTMQAAEKWFEEVERMLKDLNIETGNLTERFAVQKEYIPDLMNLSVAPLCKMSNPRDYNYDEIVKIFESLL
jgi:alcohol dehydrogenase class IV